MSLRVNVEKVLKAAYQMGELGNRTASEMKEPGDADFF